MVRIWRRTGEEQRRIFNVTGVEKSHMTVYLLNVWEQAYVSGVKTDVKQNHSSQGSINCSFSYRLEHTDNKLLPKIEKILKCGLLRYNSHIVKLSIFRCTWNLPSHRHITTTTITPKVFISPQSILIPFVINSLLPPLTTTDPCVSTILPFLERYESSFFQSA